MTNKLEIDEPIAFINVTTLSGELAERIPVTELDHINLKDYLNDTYDAVGTAIRMQGFSV